LNQTSFLRSSNQISSRLFSLDAFRGITIASMILVNTPGSWAYVYPPLRHTEWHGLTPTDLIFPFFLFIIGVAMSFSFTKQLSIGITHHELHIKVLKRFLIIFGLGLFLTGYPFNIPFSFDMLTTDFRFIDIFRRFQDIRIMGVLARIAICYFIASIIVLNLKKHQQWTLSGLLLAIYWVSLIFAFYLLGNGPTEGGPFTFEDNWVRRIDLLVLGSAHMYKVNGIPFDPEGLFSTLPAIVTVLFGVFTGDILRMDSSPQNKTVTLLTGGIIGLTIGWLLNLGFPFNKQLWSPSYTVFTAGCAALFLSGCYWLMDIRKKTTWAKPFIVFGSNSIFVFVASGLVVKTILRIKVHLSDDSPVTLYTYIYKSWFVSWAGNMNGSLLFAITWILIWLGVLWILYQKKIFIKI